ncbi:MAG: type II toxin-antitoxin system VapC family toxin [Candidatus Dormibacteraceae bacterium]
MALILDTGPLFAAMDRSDGDHDSCRALVEDAKEPIVIPAPVLVEIDWLASRLLQPEAFLSLLMDIQGARVGVEDLRSADYTRAQELVDRYRDLPLGFVDAAVLSIVERLGESKLATLDHRHFAVVRPRHLPTLRLLP